MKKQKTAVYGIKEDIKMSYKHLFGPVPSRRLGISLGVDLVPHKVCSLNCIYCECGKTTNLTTKRKEYVPTDELISELKSYLGKNPTLDYITFSGSGEPTLHKDFGKIVAFLKTNFPQYKLALLTNSTLFYLPEVREEAKQMDLILPSLDAVSEPVFKKINRPEKSLSAQKIVDGLIALRQEFKGKIWLEVFIVPNLNDSENEISLLKAVLKKIHPDEIQLNSLDRPGTEEWIESADRILLEKIKTKLVPLPVKIISKFKPRNQQKSYAFDVEETIYSTISRRPCTEEDLSEITGLHQNEINKYLSVLLQENKIEMIRQKRGDFFRKKEND
jgi:wyosine [tRNA(Phe)-imidazoG37] synthetase (radical SAM superfamily)